jgi:hypothetical protein
MHRLEAGRVPPEKFDYAFLGFKSGRWGRAALVRLATRKDGAADIIAARAQTELKAKNEWENPPLTAQERVAMLHAVGQSLPDGFLSQAWSADDDPAVNCRNEAQGCQAITITPTGSADLQVVVFSSAERVVYGLRDGRWRRVGWLAGESCPGDIAAVARGDIHLQQTVARSDLELNGHRLAIIPSDGCPATVTGVRTSPKAP